MRQQLRSRRQFMTTGAAWLASASLARSVDVLAQGSKASLRVAALFDIHGNLPALEAVIADVRQTSVDEIVVGGDVFPGPMPIEALSLLRGVGLPVRFIKGNGDRMVLAARSGGDISEVPPQYRDVVQWDADAVSDEEASRMAAWPAALRVRIAAVGEVFFCHATPRNDTEIFTRRTSAARLLPVFNGLGAPLVVCGHTHMQFDRMVGTTRVVNAGSVGMPFGEPRAYWLLLGPTVELRRTTYDLPGAAERIRKTKYPKAEEFAARSVLQPPSEQQMLDAYSKVELR